MIIIQEVEPARGIPDILKMNIQITSNSSISSSCELENKNHEQNTNINTDKDTDKVKNRDYDNTVDFRYICIKKEHFDVNMVYLKYTNLKKENYMEIIYKSPSIFLDGLFFKTPPLNISQLSIFTKDRMPFTSVITSILDRGTNSEFINMLKSIDSYLSNYIIRHARDINIKMNEDENHYLNYESILKPWYHPHPYPYPNKKLITREQLQYSTIASGNNILTNTLGLGNVSSNSKKWVGNYVINFKSYLDRTVLEALKQSILDKSQDKNFKNTEKKYVLTFNISNIYFSKTTLTPLIKCNKCQEVS
jgi:hypothetical protein